MKIPKDSYGRATILGNSNGVAVPIRVTDNGDLFSATKYELVKTMKLDLSVKREKELMEVSFDAFTIPDLDGTLSIYIDTPDEDKKLEISSCISIKVSAKRIYISNEPQDTFVNLWFFKLK